MKLIALMAAALFLPQEKNEAAELFKKMEEKLAKAKSIQAKLSGEMVEKKVTLTGELLLGGEGTLRIDLEGQVESETMKAQVISDGKKLRFESSEKPEPRIIDAGEGVGKVARQCLARGGFMGVLDSLDKEEAFKADAEDVFTVSGLKLGAREKVGEREAQAVEYKLAKKGGRESAATVWIDLETHLPLKRSLTKGAVTLTESYSAFTLDGKIDPAKFELPK